MTDPSSVDLAARQTLIKILMNAGIDTLRGYGQPVAEDVADSILDELGITTEWGTISVDDPDDVSVLTEDRARTNVARWNSQKSVRDGATPAGAVVARIVGEWQTNQEG